MRRYLLLGLVCMALAACRPPSPLEAPARPRFGALNVNVVNRSTEPVSVVHRGSTGSGSGVMDETLGPCEARGFALLADERWQIVVDGVEVLSGGAARRPDGTPIDVVASIEIAPDGSVTAGQPEPGAGPPEERRRVPGCG